MATSRLFLIDFRTFKDHGFMAKQEGEKKVFYIDKVINALEIVAGTWLTLSEAQLYKNEKGFDVVHKAARDDSNLSDEQLLAGINNVDTL